MFGIPSEMGYSLLQWVQTRAPSMMCNCDKKQTQTAIKVRENERQCESWNKHQKGHHEWLWGKIHFSVVLL